MKTNFGVTITTLAGVALLGVANSNATVTMSLVDPNAGSPGNVFCEFQGISASLDGSTLINGGDWIGLYQFAVTPGGSPAIANPFYAICLSPIGTLTDGSHTYDELDFAHAGSGINPASWQSGGGQLWGIQNAAFLYQTWSAKIINNTATGLVGSSADQGAALALALYDALYNSTAYGKNLGAGRFFLNGADTSVMTDYGDIVSALSSFNGNDLAVGYVLRPSDPNQQDMILLSDEVEGSPVVPEPATVMAGLLLLLPFGATTVRLLRNKAQRV